MTLLDLASELDQISIPLDSMVAESRQQDIRAVLSSLRSACHEIGRSWSQSWIGYHSRTFYSDFKEPPPTAHFSTEWGLMTVSNGSRGDWIEYTNDVVKSKIDDLAGNPDRGPMLKHEAMVKAVFRDVQANVVSILVTARKLHDDDILRDATEKVRALKIDSLVDLLREWTPIDAHSRDRRALDAGLEAPVHLQTLAILTTIESPDTASSDLSVICKHVAQHLRRLSTVEMTDPPESSSGLELGRVFIGHGHSTQWLILKDYISDTLGLEWDEFNRVPTEGFSTKERLVQMMQSSSMAFLVCTAEDEREPGVFHARENVIHEAGLFQGRLSFERAIIMLEEDCKGFSNIEGLTVIYFPSNDIAASFEKVRGVLQREGFLNGA